MIHLIFSMSDVHALIPVTGTLLFIFIPIHNSAQVFDFNVRPTPALGLSVIIGCARRVIHVRGSSKSRCVPVSNSLPIDCSLSAHQSLKAFLQSSEQASYRDERSPLSGVLGSRLIDRRCCRMSFSSNNGKNRFFQGFTTVRSSCSRCTCTLSRSVEFKFAESICTGSGMFYSQRSGIRTSAPSVEDQVSAVTRTFIDMRVVLNLPSEASC